MEVAGLNIVMDADFNQVFTGISQANTMLQNFAGNVKNLFTGLPDVGKKLNFTSNGASQSAQDTRELANARLLDAQAALTEANAAKVIQQQQERKSRSNKKELDDYGQLVAANQALVRAYYNEAAAQIRVGDTSEEAKAKLENLRKAAKAGQDQLQQIEAGAGRFHRQVGQYAKAFDPLNNSIQQILREMPAAAVSLNTFFLAISNNLPGFFDEIKRISSELTALKEAAQLSNLELAKQTGVQSAAAAAAQEADAAMSSQLDSIISTVAASKEQALALKEQITGSVKAATATAENAAAIAANTETLVLNAGANAEDAAALRVQMEANIVATRASTEATAALAAQALATAEATAAAAAQPSLMKRLASSIFSVNSLLTVGVLALTLYGGKLINLITGSEDAEEAIKKQKKAQEELDSAEKQALRTGADQIGKITLLEATMSNANLTIRQRTIAYNEAVKLYPAYLSNISKEEALNGGLADTIKNRLIPAIISAAKARAYQEQINILTARNIQLELEQADNIRDKAAATADLTKKTNQYIQSAAKAGKDDANALYGLSGLQSAKNKTEDLTKAINQNSEARIKNNETILSLAKKAGEQTDKAGDLNPFKKDPKTKDYTDSLNNARLEIKQAWYKVDEENKKGFDKFSEGLDFTQLELTPVYSQDQSGEIQANFDKNASAIQTGIEKEALALQIELDTWNNQNEKLKKLAKEKQDIIAQMSINLKRLLADSIEKTAESIGEGLGKIAAGSGGIGDLFKGIANVLADQVKAFGQLLIQYGTEMALANVALKALSLNPALAIAAGIALVGLGEYAKTKLQSSQKKVGKFADGGIAYGPTLGLFGEYSNARSNPEVVAPLDKLQTILKNSGGGSREPVVMIPDVQLRGSDIYLSFKRYEKGYQR